MTRLDLGRLGVWGHLDTLRAADAVAYARSAEELGYGTLWVPETVGREPVALLALLAAGTDAIHLGTSIVNIWGRDAQAARMAAMTLAEASGGRFVLGLGVSHPHLAAKLRGHDFASAADPHARVPRRLPRRGLSRPDRRGLAGSAGARGGPARANDRSRGDRCRWRAAVPLHAGARGLDARASRCRLRARAVRSWRSRCRL